MTDLETQGKSPDVLAILDVVVVSRWSQQDHGDVPIADGVLDVGTALVDLEDGVHLDALALEEGCCSCCGHQRVPQLLSQCAASSVVIQLQYYHYCQ